MTTNTDNYERLEKWIVDENHPCIMAQTVFRLDHVDYHEYSGFGTTESVRDILRDLQNYVDNYDYSDNQFFTFMALFPNADKDLSEEDFEKKLWRQLQFLHNSDNRTWDSNVARDPEDENFSFSLKGRAFYVVGLHPNSSRVARRTPFPVLTFNLHCQFEKLREMKRYQQVKSRIRRRDKKLQGSINPELEDFGRNSEARQYSGRKVEENWKCPFHQNS